MSTAFRFSDRPDGAADAPILGLITPDGPPARVRARAAAEDARIEALLDHLGVVGGRLRQRLVHAVRSKLLLRDGRDIITVTGPAGSGRHTVVRLLHAAARDILGRDDHEERVWCDVPSYREPVHERVREALGAARGGTLVIEGWHALGDGERSAVRRAVERHLEAHAAPLVLVIDEGAAEAPAPLEARRPGTVIALPPLHARASDVGAVVEALAAEAWALCGVSPDPVTAASLVESVLVRVAGERIASVAVATQLVRDAVFGASAAESGSDAAAPAPSVALPAEAMARAEHLAALHDVPVEVLLAQARVLAGVIDGLDDIPRSYTNILDRTEDVKRAALWLLSDAESQAAFRRWFGDDAFMQPSKSAAWAFYNRVFKR
jgi:hypothetical protein